jgi:hypothetical protein
MIRSPKALRDLHAAALQDIDAGTITPTIAAERLLEADADSAVAALLLGESLLAGGDPNGAEPLLWKAIAGAPCNYEPYIALATLYRNRDPEAPIWRFLTFLGDSKLAGADEIPPRALGLFEELGERASSPAAYAAMAEALETEIAPLAWPERLLPHRLLNEVQRQTAGGLDPDLLRDILDHREECAPLFRAAVRQWADMEWMSPDDDTAALLLALLGEMSGVELIDDLMEFEDFPRYAAMRHAHWAMRRVGQRFPAESFTKFRAIAEHAAPELRALLAEQIYMLPDTPGAKQAILSLLHDFESIAQEPAAPYLLLTAATLAAMLGSTRESMAVLEKHTRKLPKEGRRWIAEEIESEEGFLPSLVGAGVDELTLEHVCVDRALMDADDDDEDDEEDDDFDDDLDEEFEETVIAAPKPGRNDPCWCGSGKKYKKCHLTADEDAERSAAAPPGQDLYAHVFHELLNASTTWYTRAEIEDAHVLFFDRDLSTANTPSEGETGFFEWLFVDYRPRSTGRTLVEEFLRRRGPRLPDDERALLESWREARFGIWEVQRIEPGRGVELKDLFAGEPVFVNDVSSSKSVAKWDCIVSYIHQFAGKWQFVGNGTLLNRSLLDRFRELVDEGSREAGMTAAEFVRSRSHQWHRTIGRLHDEQYNDLRLVNAEGETLELCSAEYEVSDPDAVAAALNTAPMFEETTPPESEPGVRTFGWLEIAEGPRRSYGHIEIDGGRLRLECNSQRRLGIGRQLIEKHGGDSVRHIADKVQTQDELKKQAKESGSSQKSAPPSSLPPEVEREVIHKMMAEHYAKWVDEPLPALDGRTPREAVRSAAGRRAVEDLLRMMENSAERKQTEGDVAFDFTPIRRTLGL